MKVHYINILLFALPLNILAHNQRNHKKTILRTPKTKPTKRNRTLYECELYAPPNYDNDPEMKELMEIFNRQTSERLREYDERMQDKRQKCKEQCEKDIQKIILKDKIEKELSEKLGALQTDIRTEDIPTCVCEKSVAAKTEKVCLKCGKTMGAVAPAWGLVSGVGYVAWTQYVAAKVLEEGIKKGIEVGLVNVAKIVKTFYPNTKFPTITVTQMLSSGNFIDEITLSSIFKHMSNTFNGKIEEEIYSEFFHIVDSMAKNPIKFFIKNYPTHSEAVTNAVTGAQNSVLAELAPSTSSITTSVICSLVTIVVIVLVMVIIYLILRFRRKKEIKKKLQYIKLLNQ
ncbi:hypothetical protein PFAG_04230 [Plasmodium falciparum Santa Lucia]|uniref:Rifin n=2 Tax=Plasmodium falciparum TaxID=5833 RepID=A0A0L7KKH5_PLAFX|nr:hypothetical protein PFAG_04230 [Plasmodium falciparum Santa Lucia]KOB63817.1 hypothetical protein PFHG_04724 [Plasmodium falciparum HB3]